MKTENIKELRTENGTGVESEVKKKNTADTNCAGSVAAEPKAKPEVEVLKSAMTKYGLIQHTSLNDLKDKSAFNISSVLTERVSPVLANTPDSTCTAPAQSGSTHEMFLKKDTDDAVREVHNIMAFETHEQIFCSDVMFYRWSWSLLAAKEKVEDVNRNLGGRKKKYRKCL